MGDLFPALIDRRAQRAGSLSGGERQMVAMGRALMMEPSVLLLDEPSAGLSPVMQDEVFVQTRRINRAGVSVVMVEQNASRCLQICDRGYVLDQGRNAYTGTGRAARQGPQGHRALPRHAGQEELTAPPLLAAGSAATAHRPSGDAGRRFIVARARSSTGVQLSPPGRHRNAETPGPRARGSRAWCSVTSGSLDEAGDRVDLLVLVALAVLVDADGAGRRATGVVHVGRTAGTFVVDVLAVLEQLRALLERRSTGCPHG